MHNLKWQQTVPRDNLRFAQGPRLLIVKVKPKPCAFFLNPKYYVLISSFTMWSILGYGVFLKALMKIQESVFVF